jgi:surface antigen
MVGAGESDGKPTEDRSIATRLSAVDRHSDLELALTTNAKTRPYSNRYVGISCVPFARNASGIELQGNAANWWHIAAGVYERGSRPEAGSVLDFRANGRMHLGHVAVVTRVINSRELEIDHANWWSPGAGKGGVSRGILVADVSENNDWTAVRVGLGHSTILGSVYATYGFIYDRPDRGAMLGNNLPPAPIAGVAPTSADDEVAEAMQSRRPTFAPPMNHARADLARSFLPASH